MRQLLTNFFILCALVASAQPKKNDDTLKVQSNTIVLPTNINTLDWQMPLLGKAEIADTIPYILHFNQVQNIDFKPFISDSVFIKDDKCAWLRVHIKNPNPTDTALFFITFNNRIHFVTLFTQLNSGTIDSIAGGRLTDYYKRPFKENKACFPIALPPQYSGTFWLKFNNFSENRANLYPVLISKIAEDQLRLKQSRETVNRFIEVIYLTIFLFLALVAARLGYIWLDKGYSWYAIYIGSLFLFYFRDFENYNNDHVVFFSYFSSWHFEIEATMCYFTYIAYMVFIQKFLDMKQFYPRINTLMTFAIHLLIACLILDLCIHSIWGLATSFRIFIAIRLIFFAFYFILLFSIGFTTASSLSRFIVIGTIFMLIPSLISNIAMAFGGDTKSIYYGLIWVYDFPNFKIAMFSSRIGFVLEACFFLYGLSWKARREYDELKKLKLNQNNALPLHAEGITEHPLSIDISQTDIEALQNSAEKVKDKRVIEAFFILEKNFNDPEFTVKKWAQSVYLSPSHFSKLIVEHTQEAPSVHIQRRRLQHAQKLMQDTTLPLAQIAFDCGYNDSNYFSRIFKKTFNLTPSEWQNGHKKG